VTWISHQLWLIPALPLAVAGLLAIAPSRRRRLAASTAIAAAALAFALSCIAFASALRHPGPQVFNFDWLQFGPGPWLKLGWVLDPLSAVMLLMVSLVGLLIFIYSAGYMTEDANFTRFFCFMSLFAAAMLGLVISNSLLLLFACWELVGLASYLLIGFWFQKPSAAAAAKKAFITTRIGDLALLLGMLWLYAQADTLLFYDHGHGCLEPSALARLVGRTTILNLTVATAIALLVFVGATGKSGQVPLHVWLPDAMEGPTPVSALIHAATMVAAGVFLMARVYPLAAQTQTALGVVTWVGVITAIFAASIAVAQWDIKRILAYSTVSQLGFMMMGLGVGGVAVAMFHLITHAFFKALLFLGAGSVIHGCHGEQDIRKMGGLRGRMRVTFAAYAVGMMALSGVPIFFAGFWSKDEILHAAHGWTPSRWPFYLGVFGSFLTAFYMTRQVWYVFFGSKEQVSASLGHPTPQESPPVLVLPLIVLAAFSIVVGFLGTPAWPWLQAFLSGTTATLDFSRLLDSHVISMLGISSVISLGSIALGGWFYSRKPPVEEAKDPLDRIRPDIFQMLERKYWIDEIYDWSVVRLVRTAATASDWLDHWLWGGMVRIVSGAALALSWANRFFDDYVINRGFDRACDTLSDGGKATSRMQTGQIHHYLRILALGVVVLALIFAWGCRSS
jgi:NADH-quinone oxidoreductase subunit L